MDPHLLDSDVLMVHNNCGKTWAAFSKQNVRECYPKTHVFQANVCERFAYWTRPWFETKTWPVVPYDKRKQNKVDIFLKLRIFDIVVNLFWYIQCILLYFLSNLYVLATEPWKKWTIYHTESNVGYCFVWSKKTKQSRYLFENMYNSHSS